MARRSWGILIVRLELTAMADTDNAFQQCISPDCQATFGVEEVHISCPKCLRKNRQSLLDIRYDWSRTAIPKAMDFFEHRWMTKGEQVAGALDFSGVWRFRELLPFFRDENQVVTIGEGRTNLQNARLLAKQVGLRPGNLFLQYEGLNPSGSFKDNGMAAAFTHAKMVGARKVACASTGNTSASLAMFASLSSMTGIVFIGTGKIAYGKLSQALDYGARTLQIQGDFDACLRRVRQIAADRPQLGIYLMNSVNPFRLEGQKAIIYRVLEALDWNVPDWIVLPGGNLGNSAAFGKALAELHELGLIQRIPRIAIIQATGANPLYELFTEQGVRWNGGDVERSVVSDYYQQLDAADHHAQTIASAIEIARPVNLFKALRTLEVTHGVVREVDDETILDYKALIGRYGFGCEPASATSVAGTHYLVKEGVIGAEETVVCILTGHVLKDPDATVKYHTGIDMKAAKIPVPQAKPSGQFATEPVQVPDDLNRIIDAIGADPVGIDQIGSNPDGNPAGDLPASEY